MTITVRSFGPLSATVMLLQLGCSSSTETAASEPDPARAEERILNGTVVSDANNPGAVAIYHKAVIDGRFTWWPRPCSGTLIRKQWVLTARHCVTTDGEVMGPVTAPGDVRVIRSANPGLSPPPSSAVAPTAVVAHASLDVALLRIPTHSTSPMALWNGDHASLSGRAVRAYGFGREEDSLPDDEEDGTTGAGQLRRADLRVNSVITNTLVLVANGSGQMTIVGDSGGPSVVLDDLLGRSFTALVGVHSMSDGSTGSDISVPATRAWIKRKSLNLGDHNADGRSDITLVGGDGWTTIPVARSSSGGSFSLVEQTVSNFPTWARQGNAKPVPGDFNGDGRWDIALVGPSGWNAIPVAFAGGSGTFSVTSVEVANFPAWASAAGAIPLPGDFDGDGRGDIALTGVSGWTSIPVAYSQGNGSFTVTNSTVSSFPAWAATSGAKLVAGDFDGDGRDDIAALGVSSWNSIRIAFSNGNGTFTTSPGTALVNFAAWAATSGAKAVSGDFNGDGRDDIALTGPSGWATIPVAFSLGNNTWTLTNLTVSNFPGYAATASAKPISGDFDGDLRDDIALTGPSGWTTLPVAFSQGNGNFTVTNRTFNTFPALAATPGAKPLGAH